MTCTDTLTPNSTTTTTAITCTDILIPNSTTTTTAMTCTDTFTPTSSLAFTLTETTYTTPTPSCAPIGASCTIANFTLCCNKRCCFVQPDGSIGPG
ncbi:1963_t:CDS:1, partial [Scutellospora calospora]